MIPAFVEDFTVEWMNEALAPRLQGTTVTRCSASDCDIPGQTAEIILLDVEYADTKAGLPTKMVAKVTSRNPIVLEQVIANYDQYYRETSFYNQFRDCGIAVPDCLYADHDAGKQQMVIIMADLAPAESPSWAITPEQVKVALEALPDFHAKWWNHQALRSKDWMVQFDNRDFHTIAGGAAHASAPVLSDLYEAPALTQEIMAAYSERMPAVLDYFASRPFTFVHGDYHAKQMFFPTSKGGEFAVIDWQFPFVAQGAWDFARMLSMCMPTEVRREKESNLLDGYLSGLHNAGVTNYTRGDLDMDYRMGLIVSQMIMAIAAADTDPKLFEAECNALGVDWRDVMFDRTQYALEEWDCLGFVKSL